MEIEPIELLTQKEVAALFRVTKRTVQRWTKDQLIPSIQIGGITRYDIHKLVDIKLINSEGGRGMKLINNV